MPCEEQPKEDLIRDATSFNERLELLDTHGRRVFIGFRPDGDVSFYFDDEPVYQFNQQRQLRRAHLDGIIKAENGTLVRLRKVRAGEQVELQRKVFSDQEQSDFLIQLKEGLNDLRFDLDTGMANITRCVPHAADVSRRVVDWIASLDSIVIASRPNAS